jgi:hypothetical protein
MDSEGWPPNKRVHLSRRSADSDIMDRRARKLRALRWADKGGVRGVGRSALVVLLAALTGAALPLLGCGQAKPGDPYTGTWQKVGDYRTNLVVSKRGERYVVAVYHDRARQFLIVLSRGPGDLHSGASNRPSAEGWLILPGGGIELVVIGSETSGLLGDFSKSSGSTEMPPY